MSQPAPQYLGEVFSEGELVLGFVGAVGTEIEAAIEVVERQLRHFRIRTKKNSGI